MSAEIAGSPSQELMFWDSQVAVTIGECLASCLQRELTKQVHESRLRIKCVQTNKLATKMYYCNHKYGTLIQKKALDRSV